MAQIKSIGDVRNHVVAPEKVDVPEWGGHVHVRGLTAREYEKWQLSNMAQAKGEAPRASMERMRGATARLVVLGACDENGEPCFSDRDIPVLMDMNNKALNRVAAAVQRLAGIGDEDEIVNEFEGNSELGRTSSSTSDWPSTSEE